MYNFTFSKFSLTHQLLLGFYHFFVNCTFSVESFKLSSIHDMDFLDGWWKMDILGRVLEGLCTPLGKWGMFSTSPRNSLPKQGMPWGCLDAPKTNIPTKALKKASFCG